MTLNVLASGVTSLPSAAATVLAGLLEVRLIDHWKLSSLSVHALGDWVFLAVSNHGYMLFRLIGDVQDIEARLTETRSVGDALSRVAEAFDEAVQRTWGLEEP